MPENDRRDVIRRLKVNWMDMWWENVCWNCGEKELSWLRPGRDWKQKAYSKLIESALGYVRWHNAVVVKIMRSFRPFQPPPLPTHFPHLSELRFCWALQIVWSRTTRVYNGLDVSGVRCMFGCCCLVKPDTSLIWVTPSSPWDSWRGRRNSSAFVFSVRYELRLKKRFSLEHIIQCSVTRWQQCDGWRLLSRSKNLKKWPIKDAVESSVNMAACRMTSRGLW